MFVSKMSENCEKAGKGDYFFKYSPRNKRYLIYNDIMKRKTMYFYIIEAGEGKYISLRGIDNTNSCHRISVTLKHTALPHPSDFTSDRRTFSLLLQLHHYN